MNCMKKCGEAGSRTPMVPFGHLCCWKPDASEPCLRRLQAFDLERGENNKKETDKREDDLDQTLLECFAEGEESDGQMLRR